VLLILAAAAVLSLAWIAALRRSVRRATQSLRESEEKFRALSEQSPLGMALIDRQGRYEYVNPAFVSIFGYTLDEVPTGADGFRAAFPDPDLRGEVVRAWKEDLSSSGAGEARPRNFDVICKDGARKSIHFRPVSLSMDRQFVIYEDVTRQRELQAQLQQAMKMEAVGRLAGGVAHDFNNLLTVIIGNVSLALGEVQESAPVAGMLSEVNKAAERAARLTQQLLAFSRKQIIEPKVLNLSDLISDLNAMLVRLIREDINIQILPGKDLGVVKVDTGQFEQILVNLVVNARDAMPGGGKIVIETSNVELGDGYCSRHPYVKPGRFVMVAVSDTGHGMSEEIKAHIFEPFFTTKAKGSGTGLGLATTYGAVKQAGGSIEVYSEVGMGTTVRIYLPRVEGEASKLVKDDQPQELLGGTETVLVVEDEDVVRNLCVRVLDELGYKVLQAGNGGEAIALALGYGERIALLLTDVVMPGMSGREVANRLTQIHPETRFLFTSGYTDNAIVQHGILDEGVSFIGKPYSPSAIAKKVREVLDKA
jgi:PAS domain S-box-containing protein